MNRKEIAMLVSILANTALIALRFFLANLSGSIGLEANAWHSFTDVFVSAIVFLGLLIARFGAKRLKKAAGKIEPILAIFVALFIFYMGIEILTDVFSSDSTALKAIPFTAAGAFLGVILDYALARYKISVGEKTNSPSLIADGQHSKMDMYCSIAVLIGLLGSFFNIPSLDKIAAVLALVLIIIAGYEILDTNIRLLRHPGAVPAGHSHMHGGHHHK
jgi:membrane protease subunit HflK